MQAVTLALMAGTPDEGDWERVAAAVRSRRIQMGLSQAAAARKAKVGGRTWSEVESATGPKRLLTLAAMSRFLFGPEYADALERVANGGRPPRLSHSVAQEQLDPVEAVRRAVDIPEDGKDAIIFMIENYRNGQRRQA
jgi:transcriptional regulator with XRE-family HTH domain